jgi:hypothetical protein
VSRRKVSTSPSYEELRTVCDAAIADLTAEQAVTKQLVALLEELRTARPLVLYGDAWIARIDAAIAASGAKEGA